MILTKKLRPVERIVQERLASDLGISRTPLRSALQMLEGEYLVSAIPRKGVYVRAFTDKEIVDVYDCRIALECMAIQLLGQHTSREVIEQLKGCFARFENQLNINAVDYQKADTIFHDLLIEASANHFLCQMFRKSNLLSCIDRIGLIRPPNETLPEHLEIIHAIEIGQVQDARSLLREHLRKSRDIISSRNADGLN